MKTFLLYVTIAGASGGRESGVTDAGGAGHQIGEIVAPRIQQNQRFVLVEGDAVTRSPQSPAHG